MIEGLNHYQYHVEVEACFQGICYFSYIRDGQYDGQVLRALPYGVGARPDW